MSLKKLPVLLSLSFVFLASLATITVAAPVEKYGFGIALFKDIDPWGYPSNEVVLKRYGIPYDVYNSSDMGGIDLSKYAKVVIASDQSQGFYDAANASRAWFEEYAENGGVLEIHAADNGWNGGNWIGGQLPGGIIYFDQSGDLVNIVMHNHPVVRTPNSITDTELDGWSSSSHGHFTAYPSDSTKIMIDDSTKNPVYLEVPYGSGVILASSQTLEFVYARDYHGFGLPFSPLIENSLLYLAPYEKLDIEVNVGTIHFRGEIAEFYVKTSLYGNAINASIWESILYYANGTQQIDLLANVEDTAVGLYRITYAIPINTTIGTYILSVKANYRTGTVTATGHSTTSFLLSPTLTSQDSFITEINNKIATIVIPNLDTIKANLTQINARVIAIDGKIVAIQTDIGILKTNVSSINARVVSIDGKVVTIQTDIGTLKTSISSINATVTEIDGDIVIIKTDLGTLKTNVEAARDLISGVDETTKPTYWFTIASAILAAMAAVIAIIILMLVKKKPATQAATPPASPA
jgi:hypothetical protein